MSTGIGEIKRKVMEYLSWDGRLHGVDIVGEFPAAQRPVAVKKDVIVVGFHQVKLTPGGFGGYYGQSGDGELFGKTAEITMFLDIHCPPHLGGERCHTLYEILCDALVLEENPFGFVAVHCDGIDGDKTSHSNRLRAYATLRGAVIGSENGLPIASFTVGRS